MADIPPVGEIGSPMDDGLGGERLKRLGVGWSPDSNGVPYVYKGVPDVLKYLWKLMVIVSKKGTIPRIWHWTGGRTP